MKITDTCPCCGAAIQLTDPIKMWPTPATVEVRGRTIPIAPAILTAAVCAAACGATFVYALRGANAGRMLSCTPNRVISVVNVGADDLNGPEGAA